MTSEIRSATDQAAKARAGLLERFLSDPSGLDWCGEHSDCIDEMTRRITRAVLVQFPTLCPVSVVATGGYGRRELAPYSDVDLTVIPLDEADPNLDEAVRMLYLHLHAALGQLGLEAGYAFRLVTDAPGLDHKTRSGLLDARLVAGSHQPLEALDRLLWESFPVGEFLIAKISERETAFNKTNDTPLAVEPHLKEGAGGQRCFHCSNWIGAAIGERPARPDGSYDRVVQMRNLLHQVSGRRVDLLTRARQSSIAEVMKVDLFEMMSLLAEDLCALHEHYLRSLERLHESRYILSEGVLAIRGEARVTAGATASSAAAGIAIANSLGLRVASLAAAPLSLGDGTLSLNAISHGEPTVRDLARCGVLEAILPELVRCRTLMPSDSMHQFTVFEHTLRAVRNLDSTRHDQGFLGGLRTSLPNAAPLYLACLLHDVGKARAGRPHEESGREIALEVCMRWQLEPATADLVAWLVENHLVMAHTIRMRDVQLVETVNEFAQLVATPERLTMLTLLTWADVSAVGLGSWTTVQDAFMRMLFDSTLAKLEERQEPEPTEANVRSQALKHLSEPSLKDEELEAFVGSLPAHYLLGTSPDVMAQHFALVKEASKNHPTVLASHQIETGATEFTVCCSDQPGLLSNILGVFYAFDLSLVLLRASTTTAEPPIALDVFTVTFADRMVPTATTNQVKAALNAVLEGRRSAEEFLIQRGKDPERTQQIFRHSFHEGDPGILEVNAPRGRGMAYRISRLISAHGWNTRAARVGQWAGRGAAAFYITGLGGSHLTTDQVDDAMSGQV